MANFYCVFLKFCVFCLIFVEFSQSNQINSNKYGYDVENSHHFEHLDDVDFDSYSHRSKRDTPQLSSPASSVSTPISSVNADKVTITDAPTVANIPHLLGANGTGQRKDYNITTNDKKVTTIVSEPLNANNNNNNNNKTSTINKSLGATAQPIKPDIEAMDTDEMEKSIATIDEPEEAINKTLEAQISNITSKVDYFQYYNSTLLVDKNKSDELWAMEKEYTVSNILSKSHRRAITVQLKFDFPFYGHTVRNVTVATGGFLYTGEYVHSWLAATQYIAPLMANFDTSISNVSTVKYGDNGTAFTVIWEKVPLQDGNPSKSLPLFTFSVTLYNTGDITFAYRTVPIAIETIKDEKHPVKIGLSDAYIIDKTIYFARRKTIYEYHRVNFSGNDITNDTIIMLKALPTCLQFKDCASCLDSNIATFNCTWCPAVNRCSTGTDRKRQEWMQKNCEQLQLRDSKTCPALGTKGNNHDSAQTVNVAPTKDESTILNNADTNRNDTKPTIDAKKAALSHIDNDKSKTTHASFAVGILLPIIVVASLVLWVFYAYRNPHTKSGQLLIQYRPSQWAWRRRGEARYTAATIHM